MNYVMRLCLIACLPMLCDDFDADSSDDSVVDLKIVAGVQYAALSSVQSVFRDTKYRPDVTDRRLQYGLPEWRKIVLGHKYNEEAFIKNFHILRSLFCSFVQLLKHHVAFCQNGLKQRKHCSHQLMLHQHQSPVFQVPHCNLCNTNN